MLVGGGPEVGIVEQVGESGFIVKSFNEARTEECTLGECSLVKATAPGKSSIIHLTRIESFADVLMSQSSELPGTWAGGNPELINTLCKGSQPFAIFDSSGLGTVGASHWPVTTIIVVM